MLRSGHPGLLYQGCFGLAPGNAKGVKVFFYSARWLSPFETFTLRQRVAQGMVKQKHLDRPFCQGKPIFGADCENQSVSLQGLPDFTEEMWVYVLSLPSPIARSHQSSIQLAS